MAKIYKAGRSRSFDRPFSLPGRKYEMSTNLDNACMQLEEANTSIFHEIGRAKTDEQSESLALMQKMIDEIQALIITYG